MKRLRKLTSVMLSLSMLAGFMQVRAENIPDQNEPEEEILLTEEPAETEAPEELPVIEEDPETAEEPVIEPETPEEPAEEMPQEPEETQEPAPEETPEAEPAEEPEDAAELFDDGGENVFNLPDELYLPVNNEYYPIPITLPDGVSISDLNFEVEDEDIVNAHVETENTFFLATAGEGETSLSVVCFKNGHFYQKTVDIYVEEWIEGDTDYIKAEVGDELSVKYRLIGAAEGMEFDLNDEDTEVYSSETDETDQYGYTWFTLQINRSGRTFREIKIHGDPNGLAGEEYSFFLDGGEILAVNDSPLEYIELLNDGPSLELVEGESVLRYVVVEPDGFDPEFLTAESSDEDVVTVEPVETKPYCYRITGESAGTATLTFSAEGSDKKAECPVTVENSYFNVPETLYFPAGYIVEYPENTNLKEYAASIYVEETDYETSFTSRNKEIYLPQTDEDGSRAVVTVYANEDDMYDEVNPLFENIETTVYVDRWLQVDHETMTFVGTGSKKAKNLSLTLTGSLAKSKNKNITLVTPLEEGNDPIWESSLVSGKGTNSQTFKITPLRTGDSVVFAKVPDLNQAGKTIPIDLGKVILVFSDAPVTSIDIFRTNMTETIDSLSVEPGGTAGILLRTVPEMADPSKITVTSSDPSLVTVHKMGPYTGYSVRAAKDREGTAVLTFKSGNVTKTLDVHVYDFIPTSTKTLQVPFTGDEVKDTRTFTAVLKGETKGSPLYTEIVNEQGIPYFSSQAPITVETQLLSQDEETDVYEISVTATRMESAQIVFHANTVSGGMTQKAVPVTVSDLHITIPEDVWAYDNTETILPFDTNMEKINIIGYIPDRGETILLPDNNFNFWFELYPEDGDEVTLPVEFTVYDKIKEREIAELATNLHIGRWLNYSKDALVFKGESAAPQEMTITASGPYEGTEISIENPLEEAGNPIWTHELVSGEDSDTKTFRITPKRVGASVIFANVPDPNREGETQHIRLDKMVLVSSTKAPAEMNVYYGGWVHSERTLMNGKTICMEPAQEKRVEVDCTEELFDPAKVAVSSSKPGVVSVTRNPANPYEFLLETKEDTEGAAVITFKGNSDKVKTTVTVNVSRFINPDRNYVPMVLTGDAEKDRQTVTVTLKGYAADRELECVVEDEFGNPYSAGEVPVDATMTRISGSEYRIDITPLCAGRADIRLDSYQGQSVPEKYYAETRIHAEVREPEQLQWQPHILNRLEEEKNYNEKAELAVDQTGAVIEYFIEYYEDEGEAEAAVGTDISEDEWIVYNGSGIDLEPESLQVDSWARIAARAHKKGWLDAEKIDTVFPIVFDEWVDDMLQEYIDANHLSLNDIRDELIVLHRGSDDRIIAGAPKERLFTGSPVTFNDEIYVYYGIRSLMENVDYTVTYANNTNVADTSAKKAPTVKITGKGKYAKTWSQKFSIVKYPLSFMAMDYDLETYIEFDRKDYNRVIYTTTNAKSAPSITLTPYLLNDLTGKKTALKKGTDYEVYYYPIKDFDEDGPVIDTEHPQTALRRESGEYVYAVFALPGSKKIADTKAEIEAAGHLEDYLGQLPFFKVINTSDRTVADISKAKLSKSIGTLNIEPKPGIDGINRYDASDVTTLLTGDDPMIKLKIGTRQLIVTDNPEGQDEADVFVRCEEPVHAGTNYLWLYGLENGRDGKTPIAGQRYLTFTVKPKTVISAKTVNVTDLVKSVKLDDYNRFELWNEEGLDLKKLAIDGNKDNIKLITKSGNKELVRCDDPWSPEAAKAEYWIEVSRYTGGTGNITLTFRGVPERGYTGSYTVKIPVQVPTLADLKESGNLFITFEDMESPDTATAQYSQLGAEPKVRVLYRNAQNSGFDLQEGVDYKVKYTNNKAISTAEKPAYVTITGMGFFKGTLKNELKFMVVPANLDEGWRNRMSTSAADVAYNAKGKAGYFLSAPKVFDGTKALKAGKDYKVLETHYRYAEHVYDENGKTVHVNGDEVQKTDKPQPGTLIAVDQKIKLLNSKYTCNERPEEEAGVYWIHAEYRIMEKKMNIASSKVKVNGGKAVYLGNNWSVTPDVEVTMTIDKQKVVLEPNDYEIVSVEKNWLAGTATMVIQGKGAYYGTKKVTFKITKTPFVK